MTHTEVLCDRCGQPADADRIDVSSWAVRAVLRDGTEVPLECRYVGLVDGVHHWDAVHSLPGLPESVRVDVLPANTRVSLSVDWFE